ncbi:MAG: hypothetical protein QM820_55385 [Minicystis sp.]
MHDPRGAGLDVEHGPRHLELERGGDLGLGRRAVAQVSKHLIRDLVDLGSR